MESPLRVLIVGDSPFRQTGFGRVNAHALKAFRAAGLDVAAVTALQTKKDEILDVDMTIYQPEDDDPMGVKVVGSAYEDYQPDVVYVTGDPGNVSTFVTALPSEAKVVAYVPIEGEPIINTAWRRILANTDFFTCSQYGVDIVKRDLGLDIDYVYHGVDSETFTPLSDEEQKAYRTRLGWDGRFIVTCVAQNVHRKQLPRLIEAIAILKHKYHQRDIALYLHTVPFQGYYMDGWNLSEIATAYGVYKEVVFNPYMARKWSSIPERGTLENPGLRELIGSADLGVFPSQVEGFGLPFIESAAVGLPIAVTKYGAGWEVANLLGGRGIPVHDWEVHKSGTRYANVDPLDIAKLILNLKRSPSQLARMRQQGLDGLSNFRWEPFETMVVQKVIDGAKAKTAETQAESESVLPVNSAAEIGLSQDGLPQDS